MIAKLLFLSLALLAMNSLAEDTLENNRPIIGVVTTPSDFPSSYDPLEYSYFKASYVKWIEAGGSRVTPIPWNLTQTDLTSLLTNLNGIVFTGGYSDLFENATNSPYVNSVKSILSFAESQNTKGIFYPVFGIDQGLLAMALVISGDFNLFQTVNLQSTLHTLQFTSAIQTSTMFSTYPEYLISDVQTTPVFWFNTTYAIDPQTFSSNTLLSEYFNIVSNSVDDEGNQFVSAIEAKKWPIFAVQFHPEKAAFEWDSTTYSHTYTAIQASQLLVNRFIDETRNNMNVFPSPQVEDGCLIYNVNSTMIPGIFSPMYFFNYSQGSCLVQRLGRNLSEIVDDFVIDNLYGWLGN